MNTLLITAAIIALTFTMLLSLLALVSFVNWHIIYYVIGCRKAPVQKWVLSIIVCMWAICATIVSLLP